MRGGPERDQGDRLAAVVGRHEQGAQADHEDGAAEGILGAGCSATIGFDSAREMIPRPP